MSLFWLLNASTLKNFRNKKNILKKHKTMAETEHKGLNETRNGWINKSQHLLSIQWMWLDHNWTMMVWLLKYTTFWGFIVVVFIIILDKLRMHGFVLTLSQFFGIQVPKSWLLIPFESYLIKWIQLIQIFTFFPQKMDFHANWADMLDTNISFSRPNVCNKNHFERTLF